MVHTIHNYLFVQHHFHRTNPLIHINSRLQYANTKLTSPYYMNYSYIIQTNFCEGTLRNFDPLKNYFLFSTLYAKTNRPILVQIEYLQCVERGATKFMHGHTFNLSYSDWMADKLENRQPSQEETQSSNIFLRWSRIATSTSTLVPLLLVWHVTPNSWNFSETQQIELRTSSSNIGRRPQS